MQEELAENVEGCNSLGVVASPTDTFRGGSIVVFVQPQVPRG